MEVASIESHDNVAVPQASVIRFEVADILKLALGHVTGAGKQTSQGSDNTRTDTSTNTEDLSNQHEGAPATNKLMMVIPAPQSNLKSGGMEEYFQVKQDHNNVILTSKQLIKRSH